jgi:hypothetical protein
VSAEAEKLPGLTGYGRLKDLAAEATSNAALLSLIKSYVAATDTADAAKLVSGFDALLFAWAGVDKVAPESRGGLVDARKLGFLAAFFNDGVFDTGAITGQRFADRENATCERLRSGLRRLPARNRPDDPLSTQRRQTGILMDVHPIFPADLKLRNLSIPRTDRMANLWKGHSWSSFRPSGCRLYARKCGQKTRSWSGRPDAIRSVSALNQATSWSVAALGPHYAPMKKTGRY